MPPMRLKLVSLLFIFSSLLIAQETHNLEIIWTIPGNSVLYAFGVSMAGGDVDNDGRSDIIVSADTFDENGGTTPYLGRAYLYYGNEIGDTTPDVVFKSPFAKGTTPTRVHSADINGDNFDDIIMAEDQADDGFGGVTIFFGGNPVDTIPDFILHGRSIGAAFFGCSVSSGDVNGDGYKDLIVGAYMSAPMPGGYGMGRVYIYFGGPSFDSIPDIILNGGHTNDLEGFGGTVSGTGDVNSDQFSDIIIGAINFGTGYRGRIYVYNGGNPMDTSYDAAMIGEGPNQFLGSNGVDLLTNVFNYDHAVFGCPFWPYGFPRWGPGKVYVLFGGNPMDSIPDVWMIGRGETTGLGVWTSNAGDVNMDNCDDIISGAPLEFNNNKGMAYIWLGGTLLDTIPDAWIKGNQNYGSIGDAVASAGDVNGDGKDEIMVSNYVSAITPNTVWICKYTGQGIEENRQPLTALHIPIEVKPNPSRTHTAIRFTLNAKSKVSLKAYDITGKIVRTLNNGLTIFEPGNYEIKWDLRDSNHKKVATGIYSIEINAEKELKEIRKITVIK